MQVGMGCAGCGKLHPCLSLPQGVLMEWKTIARAKQRTESEDGGVTKEWGGRLRILFSYPNTYFAGMSNLALHLFYRVLNEMPDVLCERAFWEPELSDEPLVSLESQRRPEEFDVWAFTFSFEMDYLNLPFMLRQAGIPLFADERDESHPLLVAGGPALSGNPEPLAPFFDAIVIGEGEEVLADRLVPLWKEMSGVPRHEILKAMAEIESVYVPALHTDGRVRRAWIRDLTRFPTMTSIYTADTEFGGLHQVEISRGCGRGCRYCMAGYIYRPPRRLALADALDRALAGLGHRKRIGLVAAAVSDYPQIEELMERIVDAGGSVSVSSLRADSVTRRMVELLAKSGARTITIAPEAGTWRLRQVINKPQTDEQLFRVIEWVSEFRFQSLKLYFMIGHPTETEEDVEAIVDFVREAREIFRRNISINATPFVPKPHTPFQRSRMVDESTLERRQKMLRRALKPLKARVKGERPFLSAVQGVLARGDRRLAEVLASMRKPSPREFVRKLEEHGLSREEFLREMAPDEPLPWEKVESGIRRSFLEHELKKSLENSPGYQCPPDARGCLRCGVCPSDWAFPDKRV